VERTRGAGAFTALAIAGGALLPLGFFVDGPVGELVYLAAVTLGALLCWAGAWSRRPENPRPWFWLAAGLTFSAAADHVYYAYDWLLDSPEPFVSMADPLWFVGYVGVAMAVLGFGRAGTQELELDGIIDAAQIAVVALLLTWELSIRPSLAGGGLSLLEQLLTAAYPVIDVALLGLVIRLLLARRIRSASGGLVLAGVALWLFADGAYLAAVQTDRYTGGVANLLNAAWMAGPLVMGVAALVPSMGGLSHRSTTVSEVRLGSRRLIAGVFWLTMPALAAALAHARGHEPDTVPLVASTVVLAGLVMLRSVRLLRAHNRARAKLSGRERYFEVLAANASDAMLVLDRDARVTNESVALAGLLGLEGGTTGVLATDLLDPRDVERAAAVFDHVIANPGRLADIEMRTTRTDGGVLWMSARLVNLLDDPDIAGVVVNLHDVSAGKASERELLHQAFHDPLTGLANRALFRDRIEQAMDRGAASRPRIAVVYMDLDGFKTVNDGLGHDRGDELLRLVSARLTNTVQATHVLARLGGDEFAVLVEDDRSAIGMATALAEKVLQVLDGQFTLGGALVSVSASIGIAEGGPGITADDLLRNADVAMYRAKAAGRGRAVLFDADMRIAAEDRLRLENDLVGALERGEMTLLYQPVIDLASGDLTGFEALIRWQHPELGLLTPDRFISIAEDTGAIVPIGAWVLTEACRAASGWRAAYPHEPGITMAVNLSGRQLSAPDLVDHVTDALELSGLPPSSLVLEVTESVLVVEHVAAAIVLGDLRALGLRLAIDDFGTGYSSLSYLRQFPIDVLKIDKSFIDSITDDGEIPALVRALVDLGHTLGMEIVAEGIELACQRTQLRTLRCERGQGYLFDRPLVPAAAAARVAALAAGHQPCGVGPPVTRAATPAGPA
jgi:diguanylate cyclase (GGDEF)-like protein/PAS domain S-box-containing protein